jgi:hypothetical protein
MHLFPQLFNFFSRTPTSWFVPLEVRVHQFGNHCLNALKLYYKVVPAGINATSFNINLEKPCVLYTGRAYRYPPDVPFYIYFFFNKYKYRVF